MCFLFILFFIFVIVIFEVLVFVLCSDVFLLRFVILVIPRYISVLLFLVIIVGTLKMKTLETLWMRQKV